MQHVAKILSFVFLAVTAVILIPLQLHLYGWILWLIGLCFLSVTTKQFRKDIFLLYLSLGILGVTTISTNIHPGPALQMGLLLALAVTLPYTISRFVYKDHLVRFRFHHGRSWYKTEILYVFFSAFVAYLVLPFALHNTGSYHNWSVPLGTLNLIRLFIGTQALGLWDELFFISTVLGILRRHLPFRVANLIQSVLFTSFLYELGFRGWLFVVIFCFALLQGYIFKKTESLFYVITIHLTIDLVLYLTLIHAYYPHLIPIFIFS